MTYKRSLLLRGPFVCSMMKVSLFTLKLLKKYGTIRVDPKNYDEQIKFVYQIF